MKLKELERLINEKIEEEGNKKGAVRDLAYNVRRIVVKLIGENREIYVSDYNGNVYIRKSCSGRTFEIEIKIKKKKVGTEYERFYGYVTYYKIDKVEIRESDEFDSIEGFIGYVNKREEEKKNYEENKVNDFEKKLEEKNIDFKEFFDLMEQYKNINFDGRLDLAKKYAGKDYYKYY